MNARQQNATIKDAVDRMGQDVRKERLKVRGLRGVHLDRDRARQELTEERRALRSTRPPNSRRFRQLQKHEDAVAKAQQAYTEAIRAAQAAEQALQSAPAQDAETLASWLAGGQRGQRPEARVYEITRERDAARLLVDAATRVLDEALERRLQHVVTSRDKMIADVQKDVTAATAAIVEHVRQLPQLRERLVEARATLAWTATYPEPVPSFGNTSNVALGLQAPVLQTLGTNAQLAYGQLLAALEADADALAHAYPADLGEKLGAAVHATPATQGMWASDPRAQEWGRQELERARRLAEYGDPNALAAEIRDIRPDTT